MNTSSILAGAQAGFNPVWSVRIPQHSTVKASPEGTIVETDPYGNLAVRDSENGEVIATHRLTGSLGAAPVPDFDEAGGFRVVNGGSELSSYDKAGNLQWSRDLGDTLNREPAVGPEGNTYIYGSRGLYAVGPDGAQLWSQPWEPRNSIDAPTINADGSVVACTREGSVAAFRPEGTEAWRNDSLPPEQLDGAGLPSLRAAVKTGPDGSSYVLTVSGHLHVLDPQGREKWTVDTGIRSSQGSGGLPEVDGQGNVYLSRGNELLAWDAQGHPLFNRAFPNRPHLHAGPGEGVAVTLGNSPPTTSPDSGILALDEVGRDLGRYATDTLPEVAFLSPEDVLVQTNGTLTRLAMPRAWIEWVQAHPEKNRENKEVREIRQDQGSVTIGGVRLDVRS